MSGPRLTDAERHRRQPGARRADTTTQRPRQGALTPLTGLSLDWKQAGRPVPEQRTPWRRPRLATNPPRTDEPWGTAAPRPTGPDARLDVEQRLLNRAGLTHDRHDDARGATLIFRRDGRDALHVVCPPGFPAEQPLLSILTGGAEVILPTHWTPEASIADLVRPYLAAQHEEPTQAREPNGEGTRGDDTPDQGRAAPTRPQRTGTARRTREETRGGTRPGMLARLLRAARNLLRGRLRATRPRAKHAPPGRGKPRRTGAPSNARPRGSQTRSTTNA